MPVSKPRWIGTRRVLVPGERVQRPARRPRCTPSGSGRRRPGARRPTPGFAQQQDRGVDARGAQLLALLDQRDGEVGGAGLQRRAGDRDGAVPVAVGLDDRADGGVAGSARPARARCGGSASRSTSSRVGRSGGRAVTAASRGRGGPARTHPGASGSASGSAEDGPNLTVVAAPNPLLRRLLRRASSAATWPRRAPRGQPRPGERVQHTARATAAEGGRSSTAIGRSRRRSCRPARRPCRRCRARGRRSARPARGRRGRRPSCRGPWRRSWRRSSAASSGTRCARGGPRRRGRPRPRRSGRARARAGSGRAPPCVLGQRRRVVAMHVDGVGVEHQPPARRRAGGRPRPRCRRGPEPGAGGHGVDLGGQSSSWATASADTCSLGVAQRQGHRRRAPPGRSRAGRGRAWPG